MITRSIALGGLLLLFATGCSFQPHHLLNQEISDGALRIAPKPEKDEVVIGCPTIEDARASVIKCQNLIDQACRIVEDMRKQHAASENDVSVDQWKMKEKAWKYENEELIASCDLLLGADGTQVFPEIPYALKNVNRAGQWITKSIEAAAENNQKKSQCYSKGARAAAKRAVGLLDGRVKANPHTAILKIPRYIRAFERAPAGGMENNLPCPL